MQLPSIDLKSLQRLSAPATVSESRQSTAYAKWSDGATRKLDCCPDTAVSTPIQALMLNIWAGANDPDAAANISARVKAWDPEVWTIRYCEHCMTASVMSDLVYQEKHSICARGATLSSPCLFLYFVHGRSLFHAIYWKCQCPRLAGSAALYVTKWNCSRESARSSYLRLPNTVARQHHHHLQHHVVT